MQLIYNKTFQLLLCFTDISNKYSWVVPIGKYNTAFQLLLCFTDIFSKYAWLVSLKGKISIAITNAF